MTWWAWALLAWVVLSLPVALVVGRVIRGSAIEDRRRRSDGTRTGDEQPRELPAPRRSEESA